MQHLKYFFFSEYEIEQDDSLMPEAKRPSVTEDLIEQLQSKSVPNSVLDQLENGLVGKFPEFQSYIYSNLSISITWPSGNLQWEDFGSPISK